MWQFTRAQSRARKTNQGQQQCKTAATHSASCGTDDGARDCYETVALIDNAELVPSDDIEVYSPRNVGEVESYNDVIEILKLNYVEDDDACFRFSYEAHLFNMRNNLDLLVSLRNKHTFEIIGFIAANTCHINFRSSRYKSAIVDFVYVHKSYCGRRLCPFLYATIP